MQSSLIIQEINTSYMYLSHRLYFFTHMHTHRCTRTYKHTHTRTHKEQNNLFSPQHKNFPKLSFQLQVSVIILFYNKAFECFLLKCRRSKTRHNAVHIAMVSAPAVIQCLQRDFHWFVWTQVQHQSWCPRAAGFGSNGWDETPGVTGWLKFLSCHWTDQFSTKSVKAWKQTAATWCWQKAYT